MGKVQYAGMRSNDHGGPYRDLIDKICHELESPVLPLFAPCPNQKAGVGDHRSCWVPRASSTRPLYISLYEFVGQFMGLAIRSEDLLNLHFPPMVWKRLVNDQPNKEDIRKMDSLGFE